MNTGVAMTAQNKRIGAARRGVALVAALAVLNGCAAGGGLNTQSSRIGSDDGSDSCRPQLVALDSTGDFYGESILKGAVIGGLLGAATGALISKDAKGAAIGAAAGVAAGAAAGYWSALRQQQQDQAGMFTQVQGDLTRENAQIDKTQLAFDQLMDCRFRQARMINDSYTAHQIDRTTAVAQMAVVRQHAQRDLALAKQIDTQIAQRGQQFDVAADNLAPSSTPAFVSAEAVPAKPATVRRAGTLKLRPDPAAPDIGQVAAKEPVKVTVKRGDYALVETGAGVRGYTPVSDLQQGNGSRSVPVSVPSAPAVSNGSDVRTLDGSNAARRDAFSQSVAVSQTAVASGFEVAG
ncbi:MAG TPA: SH3 domain-containing protein [Aliidongia sp.]|uniref:SH3 domain-containing protein n=1 Tax=Aliidongia sp. TaxID=1914230 RepID=UPI002DDD259C|nr:SH3 domain-containing protein [Aliidongia sp.]HEV2677055.1 SH3 domain-containing protein [Aliidongia sp.]